MIVTGYIVWNRLIFNYACWHKKAYAGGTGQLRIDVPFRLHDETMSCVLTGAEILNKIRVGMMEHFIDLGVVERTSESLGKSLATVEGWQTYDELIWTGFRLDTYDRPTFHRFLTWKEKYKVMAGPNFGHL